MPIILDGKKARDFYKAKLASRAEALCARGISPRLAILQIGDNKESTIYIAQKNAFAAEVGARVDHVLFPADIGQTEVAETISLLNADPSVHGIIIQLPIPAHLDKLALIESIDPQKDVDGLTGKSQELLDRGTPRFIPATAKGVMALLDFYSISVTGKRAVVFGRSRLVGHPIAELLRIKGASVEVCHSKTENARVISRSADIIVVAVGKSRFMDASYIGDAHPAVVDVGINSVVGEPLERDSSKRKVVGDVDFDHVAPLVSAISPVPGGVGPMTVLSLFDNLMLSAEDLTTQ